MNSDIILLIIAIALVVILFALFDHREEQRQWNNGVSPAGVDWQRLSVSRSGSRLYGDGEGNIIEISWPDVDDYYRPRE